MYTLEPCSPRSERRTHGLEESCAALHTNKYERPSTLNASGYLQMKAGMHVALPEYAKEFGPICKIFFGRYPIVLISDPELVKEVHTTS